MYNSGHADIHVALEAKKSSLMTVTIWSRKTMRTIKAFTLTLLVLMVMGMTRQAASAEDYKEIPPFNHLQKIEQSLQLHSPVDVEIWNKQKMVQDVSKEVGKWTRSYWICHSDADDQYGACATQRIDTMGVEPSTVKLRFTEARSRLSYSLELHAGRYPYFTTRVNATALNSAWRVSGRDASPYLHISARIPASELKKLPVGGIWKANLKLRHMHDDHQVAETNAEITLHVKDTRNVQIFLPEHNTTTPTVDLGLTGPVGPRGRTTGRRNIDMCLYDGYGSNSSLFDVMVTDGQSLPGSAPDFFSVIRDGTPGQVLEDRISYRVTYVQNGQRGTLENGRKISLKGGDSSEVRSVHLPNIAVPVLCKPMPLTLETLEFGVGAKRAGRYTGKLKIIFSPSAQSL